MKSKVKIFCVLIFCSKIVDSIHHSEDFLRQRDRREETSQWQVDQNAQDAQYLDTEFTKTRNVNPLTNPVIQQASTQDLYQERYNYDGYGYNKSPVGSPSGKELLGSYNSQVDGLRLESYPPRVESYPSQVGFDNQQFRNPNWRSQNQYTNSAPSGVLITDSERPLETTVQEPYRGLVQYPQLKYASSSNRRFHPDRAYGKYVANSAHHFGSISPVPYDDYSEGQAVPSEIKARMTGGQRYLQKLASQSGNIYNEVPVVIADTLVDQSEKVKYLENYRSTSNLINIAPSTNYDDGSPVISEIENYSLDSRSSNAPVSYESYSNGQAAASDIKARLTGGRRNDQNFAPQSEIIYKESAVVSTDTLKDLRKDRSSSDLSNTVEIINYDDDSPAFSSTDNYSSGSRPSNVRVPYEMYGEAQTVASELKPRQTGGRRYMQTSTPESRITSDNVPAVITTDILAEQSRTVKNEKRQNYESLSDSSNIASITNQEDSSPVISAAYNTETDSILSNPTPEYIKKKAPVDISKVLSDKPLGRRYAHNYRSETGLNNIARDDSYSGAPTVISETAEGKSGSYEVNYRPKEHIPINTNSETSSSSRLTRIQDVSPNGSSSSIPSNANLNHKSSSGITELSLVNLLSKTDIDKFMAKNSKRFLVIHPNKTVEYVDNIDTDSHQNLELRLVNIQPKNVGASDGDGTQLPENVNDNPVDETDSNLPIEDLPTKHSSFKPLRPHVKQQAGSGSLKPLTPLLKPLTPLVSQAEDDVTPYKPLTYPENQPQENKFTKSLHHNIRHPVQHYNLKSSHQPADYNNSKPLFPDGNQLAVDKNFKPQPPNANQPGDENNSNSPSPGESQPSNESNAKTLFSNKNQSGDNNDFIPSSPYKRWLAHHHNSKRVNQLTNDYNSNPSSPDENQSTDAKNSKPLPSNENQPGDDNDYKPVDTHKRQPNRRYKSKSAYSNYLGEVNNASSISQRENKPADDDSYKITLAVGNHPAVEKNSTPQSSNENQSGDDIESNPSSPDENQQSDDNNAKTLPLDENESVPDDNLKLMDLHKSKPARHNKTKFPNVNQSDDVDNVTSSTLSVDKPANDDDSHSIPSNENLPGDDNDFKPLRSHKKRPAHHKQSKLLRVNQQTGGNNSKLSSPDKNQPEDKNNSESLISNENQLEDDTNTNPSPPNEYQPESDNNSNPTYPDVYQPSDSNNSNLIPPNENQSGDDADSKPSSPDERDQPGSENYSDSPSSGDNQSADENNSNPSSSEENQPEYFNNPKPSRPYKRPSSYTKSYHANQSEDDYTSLENNTGDDNNSNSLSSDESQPRDDNNAKTFDGKNKKSKPRKRKPAHNNNKAKPTYENQSEIEDTSLENKPGNDNILSSSSPDENELEDDKESKPLRSYEKQPTYDSKPTSPVVSKIDENPESTTISPTTPNYTTSTKPQVVKKHKHRLIRRKSTTSSPTQPTSEDQIITISPIEQVTDNVSDVPPVTTSTTTAKPIEALARSDTIKDDNDKQDDNSANSSSEDLDSISDQVQTSAITASSDKTSGDKSTKKSIENNKKQTNNKAAESPDSKKKNYIQTVQSAVYNSTELLDTNTDVPAESDVYLSVITSPSVQNDVNTGDASGDNILELEQPETDITITVSSKTDNNSEDDVITINIEVSESAGSSASDKSLLISIDTDDDGNDDSKTSLASSVGSQSTDCKKDHIDDDGKGKNLEIDMSNIQGKPTMWIRTTNQDFIEKLTTKNDTAFDVVYFFNMITQPIIEREKETTFYCNGTVVVTIKETTYPNKDDPTPNVEKISQTMQIEDYLKRYDRD